MKTTKHRRARQSQAASEELQKAMIACSPLAIYSIDRSGKVMSWNESAQRIFGWAASEVVGRPLPIVQPDKHDEFTGFVQRILAGESLTGKEVVRQRKDGSLLTGSLSCSPLRGPDGEIIGIMSMMEDISARKRIDEALRASEARYRAFFENSLDAILLTSPDGSILAANPAACDMFNKSEAEIIRGGRNAIVDRADPRLPGLLELRERIGKARGELTLLRQGGIPFPAEISSAFFQDREGMTRTIMVIRDLSDRLNTERERQHLQDQLYQAQKLESVGRLAGGIAHDFNNLLSIVLGYGEALLEETDPKHPHHEPLTQIIQSGLRARNLTRQLLAFSRKQILEMRRLDLNEVVTGFEKLLRRVIGEDIVLNLSLAGTPLPINGGTAQLEQVLMNLAVNARDAMPEGGSLTIATAATELDQAYAESKPGVIPGAYAMVSVSDTGSGMEGEILARIFEPFFTTKTKDKGTGLGLATTYGIVKQHKGNIWVYSEPGKGSTFTIYLPLAAESEPEVPPAVRLQQLPPGSATVLIVEDEPTLRQMVTRILSRKGYTVIETENVDDAITKAEALNDPLHLVLSDVIMPGMQGPEVVARIRALHPESRVLYMSGYADDVIARSGVLVEGIQFIQKPFTMESLLTKIHEILNG